MGGVRGSISPPTKPNNATFHIPFTSLCRSNQLDYRIYQVSYTRVVKMLATNSNLLITRDLRVTTDLWGQQHKTYS